jgi:membrane-associated protease RseP (regulator of RpoE activity)
MPPSSLPEPYHLNGYHSTPSTDVLPTRKVPVLHIALFLTTLVTTSMAGAFQQGANPIADPTTMLRGLPFAATLMSILLFHEMGHYLLARVHGIHATLPYFIPAPPLFVVVGTFGAFIRMKSPPANRRALFDVGAAGPWAGIILAIPAAIIGLSLSEVRPLNPFDEGGIILGDSFLFSALTRLVLGVSADDVSIVLHPIALAGWFGFFVTFLNLLPVGQLDGGHVMYSLFGRWHRWISRGSLIAILFLGFHGWVGWFMWVALLSMLGVDHPPTLDLHSSLDPRRKVYAWCTVVLFVLTFMPVPISLADRPALPSGEVTHVAYQSERPLASRSFTFVYRP